MANKEKNFASAVIYVHNAENRIGQFLRLVMEVLEENFEYAEIICVNDSSEDGSLDVIRKIGQSSAAVSVSVVNMSCFHGLEVAMNAGVDLSIGDYVFEFDNTVADFDRSEIMAVYRRALGGDTTSSALFRTAGRGCLRNCSIAYLTDLRTRRIGCTRRVSAYSADGSSTASTR